MSGASVHTIFDIQDKRYVTVKYTPWSTDVYVFIIKFLLLYMYIFNY